MDNNKRNIQEENTSKEYAEIHGLYQKKWDSFTKKLSGLMKENPSLLVVISPQSFDSASNIGCAIAYVHENSTGEPKEKIILIYNVDDNHSDEISDDNDIPF